MKLIIFTIVVVGSFRSSSSLEFDGIEETYTCDKFPIQENLDSNWVASISKWYVPLWNKVEFIHNALLFLGERRFVTLDPSDLELACATYSENGTSVTFTGFGGKLIKYQAYPDPLREGIYHWGVKNKEGNEDYVATSYTTFSDNANVVVTVCLWKDGRKGFTVGSPTKTISQTVLKKVETHLEEIGFNPQNFVRYSYDKCENV